MSDRIQERMWFCAIIILLLLLFPAQGTTAAPNSLTYTRLRAELWSKISTLEARVKALEDAAPPKDGVIRTYVVDSVAGEIVCTSCRFKEEEKDKQ